MPIKVAAFNILAPCWAHPKWYNGEFSDQLNTAYRRPRLRAEISKLANQGIELFLLAETQPSELDDLFNTGGLNKNNWIVYHVAHASYYWQNWWITDPAELEIAPWTADHTNHGVAILAKKNVFSNIVFTKISASTGNSQAMMSATYIDGTKIRAVSVHYDSDSSPNRQIELETTIRSLPLVNNTLDIIGGDFNSDTNSGNLQNRIKDANFYDMLYSLGIFSPTHPWSTSYYRSMNWAAIDHFIVRSGNVAQPTYIEDNYLYNIYPIKPPPDQEYDRVVQNFNLVGSDHFPIISSANIS